MSLSDWRDTIEMFMVNCGLEYDKFLLNFLKLIDSRIVIYKKSVAEYSERSV